MRPRTLGATIQLPPRPGRDCPPCPPSTVGDCTEAITGLRYCHYNEPLYVFVSDEGTPPTYTLQATEEEPVCSDEDLAFVLSGGYVESGQDGFYVFELADEHCNCELTWTYLYEQDADPVWADFFSPYIAADKLIVPVIGSATYAKAVVSISVECRGQTYGPITITLSSSY